MRVRLESLGCRLNLSEMESAARAFARAGHRVVGPGEKADLCILNTCTVTAMASRKSRQLLRQLRQANPGADLVATGCYTEMAPEAARDLGLDLIVSNSDKDRLVDVLTKHSLLPNPEPGEAEVDGLIDRRVLRTRAFLKVQDGCDNRCTYCVVTLARGAGRSRPLEEVLTDIVHLREAGYNEVVLSGVHLGSYGYDLGIRRCLEDLVRSILDRTDLPRLRLSSLEPWDLEMRFFDLFTDPRVLPHLHLPLQSGCNATLARMARRTTQREFAQLIDAARQRSPGISISTDIIAGFPGETDAEFEQSFSFVESMGFSRLHVFRYSRRPGTVAADLPDQVPGPISTARSRRLIELGVQLENRFNRSAEGKTVEVLWEESEPYGDGLRWSGLTPNYIRVTAETPASVDLLNTIHQTRIVAAVPGGLLGEVDDVAATRICIPKGPRLTVLD